MDAKKCARCGVERAAADFPKNKRMKGGLDSWCRPCRAAYARANHWRRKGVDATPPKQRKAPLVVRDADGAVVAKLCTDCDRLVPAAGYSRNRTSSTGLTAFCKPCQRAREDQARHKRAYGITVSQAEQMRASQDGICAVCASAPAEHFDHNHVSGVVRAWLCQRCNMGLGLFGDSAARLRQAADYLDRHDSIGRDTA